MVTKSVGVHIQGLVSLADFSPFYVQPLLGELEGVGYAVCLALGCRCRHLWVPVSWGHGGQEANEMGPGLPMGV